MFKKDLPWGCYQLFFHLRVLPPLQDSSTPAGTLFLTLPLYKIHFLWNISYHHSREQKSQIVGQTAESGPQNNLTHTIFYYRDTGRSMDG